MTTLTTSATAGSLKTFFTPQVIAVVGVNRRRGAIGSEIFHNLTAGGFYTTPEGWKDIGYVGNVALAEFPGPPPEVLKHLGLA